MRNVLATNDDYRSTIRGFVNQKWVPYSQLYLFNAIPDTNHNANPTNPNHYSKGNPNPTNPTNPNTRYRIIEPSDYRYITQMTSANNRQICTAIRYTTALTAEFQAN